LIDLNADAMTLQVKGGTAMTRVVNVLKAGLNHIASYARYMDESTKTLTEAKNALDMCFLVAEETLAEAKEIEEKA
jgi:hypothetical protein